MRLALLAVAAFAAAACRRAGPPPDIQAPAAALETYARGDLAGAEKAMNDVVKAGADDARARNWRGRLKLERLDFKGAEDDFSRAIELEPLLAAAWYNRGNVRIDLGKLPQALEDLGQAARLDNELEGAPYSAGAAKQAIGDYRGAAEAYAIALKVNPGMRQARLRRAETLAKVGERDEALTLLDKALAEDPDAVGALVQRGGLRESMHEPAAAIEDYARVVELLPGEALGYRLRAGALRDALRLPEAAKDYDAALSRAPEDAELFMDRGRLRYHQKRYEDAIKDWGKAAVLDPSYAAEIRAYLQYIRSKKGKK